MEPRDEIEHVGALPRRPAHAGSEMEKMGEPPPLGSFRRLQRPAHSAESLEEMSHHPSLLAPILRARNKRPRQLHRVVAGPAALRARDRFGGYLAAGEPDETLGARAQERVAAAVIDQEPVAGRVRVSERGK